MYEFEIKYRVPYADTDQMGVVYYGNYAKYYEIGRTELIRSLNYSYKYIEQANILMPVINMKVKYIRPALYDDMLTIKTILKQLPSLKITFFYEIYNERKILLNIGETQLAFLKSDTMTPSPAPDTLMKILQKVIDKQLT